MHPPRHQTIGASSEPYGDALVTVHEATTDKVVATVATSQANQVRITGLVPDTEYTTAT